MLKMIIMMVLSGLSNSVMAEWTKVDWTDEYTNYVDLATIQVNGYRVKMWHLLDYKTIQKFKKGGFLSMKSQYEYDCQEQQTRGLATTVYSDNMGYGQIIGNDYTEYPWHPVQPGSVKEDNFKTACKILLDGELRDASNDINKGLPMNLSKHIRLDTTLPGPGALFTYFYTLAPDFMQGLNINAFLLSRRPSLITSFCSDPTTKVLFVRGVTVRSTFTAFDGRFLGNVDITPKDCGYTN